MTSRAEAPTPDTLREALRAVKDPASGRDIVAAGLIEGIEVRGGLVPGGAPDRSRSRSRARAGVPRSRGSARRQPGVPECIGCPDRA